MVLSQHKQYLLYFPINIIVIIITIITIIVMQLTDHALIFFTLLLLSWSLLLSLWCWVSKTHYIYVTTHFFCFSDVWRVIMFIWLYVPIELNSTVLTIYSGTNYSSHNCSLTNTLYAIFITIPLCALSFVICFLFVCFCLVFERCIHSTCAIKLTTKP